MTVRTYRPGFDVTLYKNVMRKDGVSQRQSAAQGEAGAAGNVLDLTPYLGDGSQISVTKDLYQPCGSFIITVPDQPIVTQQGKSAADTLYGIVEPMDGIDIRLARSPWEYGGELPVCMLGLVREVSRNESMGPDGKPRRYVVIHGQDYGSIFANILRVIYIQMAMAGNNLPDEFRWLAALGDAFVSKSSADFMRIFIKLANDFLTNLTWRQGGWAWNIQEDISVTEGIVFSQGLHEMTGPVWGAMLRESDAPWNELFIEDREDGPTLVYRPTPFKEYVPAGGKVGGTFIEQQGQIVVAEGVEVDDADIVRLICSRSDYNAANVFWAVGANSVQGSYAFDTLYAAIVGGSDEVLDRDHENNDPELYGNRLMTAEFRQTPTSAEGDPTHPRRAQFKNNNETHYPNWYRDRLHWLKMANRDNVVLENGTIALKGNENIKVGKYLYVTRGKFEWECYATSVTHEFSPYQAFTTTVGFIRGTCFWNRIMSESSPYLLEGRKGVYS